MLDDLVTLSVGKNEKKQAYLVYLLMKEFGYTLDEVKQMPLTTFNMCIKFLMEDNKKMKQRGKGGKRR
jgi:hypothetical protein